MNKKIFSLLLSIVMIFSSTIFAHANPVDKNKAAYETFYKTVSAAFAEKGKILIMEYDETHTYTQDDIDAMLTILENDEVTVIIESSPVQNTGKSARLMPVTFRGSEKIYIGNFVGWATFTLNFKGTIDVQGNNIMGVDLLNIVLLGSINYTSHTLSLDWYRNDPANEMIVTIEGYVLFEGTVSDLKYSINEPVSTGTVIDALDYI